MTLLAALLLAIPTVVLSNEHQAMTAVGVGDTMPALPMSDASGRPQTLDQLGGEKATVVALMNGPGWMSETLTGDLGRNVVAGYSDRGVRVVAVGLGGVKPIDGGVTSVRADRAEAESLLGAGRMPRVYVLDGAGKIVWFDIEYSVSTHREMLATLDEMTKSE